MSGDFSVSVNGKTVEIKVGDSIDDIKQKTGLVAGNIWDGVDANNNNTLDAEEADTFKTNLRSSSYAVRENSLDGPSPNAFNDAITNAASRYDKDNLKGKFSDKEEDKVTVNKGDTLSKIVDAELDRAGIPKNNHTRNALMAQIKALNPTIRDVNNIRVGTKLIVKYTPAAIREIKKNSYDNRATMGGADTVVPQSGTGKSGVTSATTSTVEKNFDPTEKDLDGKTWTEGTFAEGEEHESNVKVYTKGDETVYVCEVDDGKVKFDTLEEANAFSKLMADEDHNIKEESTSVSEGFTEKDPQPTGEDALTKGLKVYEKTTTTSTGDDATTTTETKYVFDAGGKKVEFDSLDAAKRFAELANPENKEDSEVTEAEVAKALKAYNIGALQARADDCEGNVEILKQIATNLKGDGNVDITSDEVKALVKQLVEMNNADVLTALALKEDPDSTSDPRDKIFDVTLFDQDEESLNALLDLYKDLRAKELNGEKLSDDEHALVKFYKDNIEGKDLGAAGSKRVDKNGDVYYAEKIGEVEIKAESAENLAKFKADYSAKIGDDAKKHEIFTEYASTDDKYIRAFLAEHANDLKATKDDIIGLIDGSDNKLELLNQLDITGITDATAKTALLEHIAQTALAEFKPADGQKPDPANMMYLEKIFNLLGTDENLEIKVGQEQDKETDGTLKVDGDGNPVMVDVKKKVSDIKQEIIDSFFKATATGEGDSATTTYAFEPSRMPTNAEMKALLDNIGNYNVAAEGATLTDEQKHKNDLLQALVNYIKPETMGNNEYSAAIEYKSNIEKIIVPHFAELVDKMDKEQVLDFIDKMRCSSYNIPFDKIIEKFSTDPQVMRKLADKFNSEYSTISPTSAMTLAKAMVDMEYSNVDKLGAILGVKPADDAVEPDKTAYTTALKGVGTALQTKAEAMGLKDTAAYTALKEALEAEIPADATIREQIKALNTAIQTARNFSIEPAYPDGTTEEVKTTVDGANQFLLDTLRSSERPEVVQNTTDKKDDGTVKKYKTITTPDGTKIKVWYTGADNSISQIDIFNNGDKRTVCYISDELYYSTDSNIQAGNGEGDSNTSVDYGNMTNLIDFVKLYFGDWQDPPAPEASGS